MTPLPTSSRLVSHNQDTEDGRYCPKCGADWRASEIPHASVAQGIYGPHQPPCEKKDPWDDGYDESCPCSCPARYYSRLIGLETPDYDGISLWLCPDCGTRWDRWSGEEIG